MSTCAKRKASKSKKVIKDKKRIKKKPYKGPLDKYLQPNIANVTVDLSSSRRMTTKTKRINRSAKKNIRSSSTQQARIKDLCNEDKQKLGLVVKSLASKVSKEREINSELKRKYEEVLKDFEEVKSQLQTKASDPHKNLKERARITQIKESESDQDQPTRDINKCATQSSFRIHRRDIESFCPEVPAKFQLDAPKILESNRATRIENQTLLEISKLKNEVKQLSINIKELSNSASKKGGFRLHTCQDDTSLYSEEDDFRNNMRARKIRKKTQRKNVLKDESLQKAVFHKNSYYSDIDEAKDVQPVKKSKPRQSKRQESSKYDLIDQSKRVKSSYYKIDLKPKFSSNYHTSSDRKVCDGKLSRMIVDCGQNSGLDSQKSSTTTPICRTNYSSVKFGFKEAGLKSFENDKHRRNLEHSRPSYTNQWSSYGSSFNGFPSHLFKPPKTKKDDIFP
ncbi:unnamed protein product [Moneuplotes crassus]|uniref:Uncharacterized protein n=1 Tax=Euplotes crassus TaxID=5936 RepID=A0AAD1XF22_EUPCR|nr:unnamed protein product [Moneuplotes crassus]